MKTNSLLKLLGLGAIAFTISSCNGKKSDVQTDSTSIDSVTMDPDAAKLKPVGPAPEWGPSIKAEMQVVTEKLASYGDKPIEKSTVAEARKAHTAADAVKDIMAENAIVWPDPKCDTVGKDIPVAGGTIHARVYTPKGAVGPLPVIVYYHGGGFVIANIDVYHTSAMALCEQTAAIVVSVAYRLAPEHKFPTAHNDSFAAYEWVTKNADSINGDPKMIAVVGESAGGNLAANMSIMARDKKITMPVAQVLIYPVAQSDMNVESYVKYASAKPLNKPMMMWFVEKYLTSMAQAKDPRINLVAANLKGLPPTTIITAEIDPLSTDGAMLADKLKAAGVEVDRKVYDGVTHEFFGTATVVPQAKDAQKYAADALRRAFKK